MREAIAEFARRLTPGEFAGTMAALAAVALLGAWFLRRGLTRARILEDTPTSLIRSAAQGYCELNGYAVLLPGATVRSPLSGATCCWWRYEVAEYVRSGKNSRWQVVDADVSGAVFALDDPTGRCVIDPDGADVIPSRSRTWYGPSLRPTLGWENGARFGLGQRYRYREEVLLPDVPLYAIGWFESVDDPFSGADAQRELAAKLAEWKKRPQDLLTRFDRDRDGKLDGVEWEAARGAAKAEVGAEQERAALTPGVNVLKAARDDRPFLLSTIAQDDVIARCRWQARAALLPIALAAWLAFEVLTARGA
jgi:hypothetical protein